MRPQLWQLVRFGLVGAVNTGTFYLLYLLLHPHLPYFAAFTGAFFLSMVGSFFMNTYFTYRTRPTWRKFLLFPLPNVTNYLVQSGGVFALVEWARMDDRIAPLPAAAVAIPITYVLSKIVLTGRGEHPARPAPDRAAGSAQSDDLGAAPVRVEVVEQ
ncbi:GtrA family protein [Kitasatospora sp. NBC_01539]|uniref:GtrA family protein n=1 Tax=Kitasatospora sp. NBC_01539 TaxID=2903577 RepID=UPI0038601746